MIIHKSFDLAQDRPVSKKPRVVQLHFPKNGLLGGQF